MAFNIAANQIQATPFTSYAQGRALTMAQDKADLDAEALRTNIELAKSGEKRTQETHDIQIEAEHARQLYDATGKVLEQGDNAKAYVEQNFSDVIPQLEQHGLDWKTASNDDVLKLAQGMRDHAAVTAHISKEKPIEVASGAALVDPITRKPIFTNEKPDQQTTDKQNYDEAVKGGFKGSFLDYQIALKHAGASNVSVTTKQDSAEANTVGEGFGKQYIAIQQSGLDASGKIARFERLQSLLDGVNTGKLTPSMTTLSAIGDSLGIKLDPKLGAKQAAQALSAEVALQLRNPSGGAGMPGAMSDKDREFLQSMTPNLSQTPEGNKLILETAIKMANREKDIAKQARDYRKKNGKIDEGFYDALGQWSDEHPLFHSGAAKKISSDAEYNALPSGAEFIAPDGSHRKKP